MKVVEVVYYQFYVFYEKVLKMEVPHYATMLGGI